MAAAEAEPPRAAPAPVPSADAIPPTLRRRVGGGTRAQVFALTLVGTLLLAVFASRDLSSWLDRLGDGPILVPLQHAAAHWDGAMAALGLTRPQEVLRQGVRRALDAGW